MTTPSAPSYRFIALSKGQFAKVDASDFDWLNQHKWSAKWNRHTRSYYAERRTSRKGGTPARTIIMHREILGFTWRDGKIGDHENRDTLDNRRQNLRDGSKGGNSQNQKLRSTNTSGYKGVSREKGSGVYVASIWVNSKRLYLGRRKDIGAAAELYREASRRLHGEFSRLV